MTPTVHTEISHTAETGSFPKDEKRDFISDSIFVVLLTAGTYIGAYVYELSYLSFFGIPPELIDVSVATLVAVGGWLLILSILGAQIMHVIWSLDGLGFFQPQNGYGLFVKKWGLLITLWCLLFLVGKFDWLTWINMSIWALIIVADLVVPVFFRGTGISYKERLANWLDAPEPEEMKRHTIFKSGFSKKLLSTILLIAVFAVGCNLIGTLLAKTRSSFGFVEDFEENVIIRKYGDRFLLAKYDWDRQSFVRQFRVIEMHDIKSPIVWRKLPTYTVNVDGDSPNMRPTRHH